ncbi:MAG: DUF1697 domain-containing protein [Rhodobacteraceae bacterium]|nr:DUF1697 domain-containing protein [Paracoccaceae bacterium]
MVRHVALLYSVVLGPGRRVRMDDLRAMAEGLGFERVRSLVATGNLVFDAPAADPRLLEQRLETAFAARFGRHVDIILRDSSRWRRLMAGNPFPDASLLAPDRVAVRVMRAPAGAGVLEALGPYRSGDERMALVDGDLWVHFPHGQGGSRLAGAMKPQRAGGPGTFRNWNTVRGIGAMLEA